MIASATLDAVADDATKAKYLPGLADGSTFGAVALDGSVTVADGQVSGNLGAVLGGGFANVLLVLAGDDVAVVEVGEGVKVETPKNLDPTRRSARITLDGAPCTVIPGARQALVDRNRLLLSAEAMGVALECTELAAAYSKERIQFGRPIAMYQAVKHHCANMCVATELTTSAVWDAAMAAEIGEDQLSYAAAIAATLAAPAADLCANLNTQVHGGIAITWEHDAHLYMRRATTLLHFIDSEQAAEDLVDLSRKGVVRTKDIKLPPEADKIRAEVKAFADSIKDLSAEEQRNKLIETGYVMPHWPKPYGRDASAIEQLVIEQEFSAAEIKRPQYGITAWNILTIIQHGNQDQMDHWVLPALNQEVVWCQLFSEPDAGSDAAGVKTKATRVDGGWLVNGQKVWTSGAHYSGMGFATVRTNPDVPKHDGITMMAIDMHAEGVEVRPLKMTTGNSEFNEVFFSDVFVPDDNVVGSGRRRLDRRPSHPRQRERVDRRRGRRQHVDGRRDARADVRRPPRAAVRRRRPPRALHRRAALDRAAQPARRQPRRVRRRSRPRGRHDQARAERGRPRVGRHHDGAQRRGERLHGRPRRDEQHDGAHAPRHVHRRRHQRDQAQPDRRAHPRPPARPADQVAGMTDFPLPYANADLTGQVALVTGASSGLGRRFALTLAAAGASVAACARRVEKLDDLVAEITASGGYRGQRAARRERRHGHRRGRRRGRGGVRHASPSW